MNYEFPYIENLSDIEHVVDSHKSFNLMKKDDGYYVIDYSHVESDTFPDVNNFDDALRREFRGIIFDENGILIRRPYHKFFNFQERQETIQFDFTSNHVIQTKEDGSMIAPFIYNNEMIFGSMHGRTFLTPLVENFLVENPHYKDFSKKYIEMGYTPIFEFCSNKNRIVIYHDKDRLVLTGIRHMNTGEYIIDDLPNIAHEHNIECVQLHDSITDIKSFVKFVRNLQNVEGFVAVYDSGHRIKFKTDDYCRIHKVKEKITNEKHIVDIILNGGIDDIVSVLNDDDKERVIKFRDDFNNNLYDSAKEIVETVKYETDFKDFYLNRFNGDKKMTTHYRKVFDNGYDINETFEYLKKFMISKEYTSSSTRLESVRHLFKVRWEDY